MFLLPFKIHKVTDSRSGDMGIAVPSAFVSIGDLESVKNALQTMYNYQVSQRSHLNDTDPDCNSRIPPREHFQKLDLLYYNWVQTLIICGP
jgi:hypothetical protein